MLITVRNEKLSTAELQTGKHIAVSEDSRIDGRLFDIVNPSNGRLRSLTSSIYDIFDEIFVVMYYYYAIITLYGRGSTAYIRKYNLQCTMNKAQNNHSATDAVKAFHMSFLIELYPTTVHAINAAYKENV